MLHRVCWTELSDSNSYVASCVLGEMTDSNSYGASCLLDGTD